MAMIPVHPNTHPQRLQQYMTGFRRDMHQTAEAARKETDPDKALAHVSEMAEQVEYLGSIVLALTNAIAQQR